MTWHSAVIYGIAAMIALQGLLTLMTAHRKAALRKFLEEESRKWDTEPVPSSEVGRKPDNT